MPDNRPNWRSVRVRITVVATVVVGLTILVASFALIGAVRRQLVDRLDAQNTARMRVVASKIAAGLPPDEPFLLPAPASGFVVVQDENGRVLRAVGVDPRPIFVKERALDPGETGALTLETGDAPFDVTYTKVPSPGGPFTVFAGSSLDGVNGSVDALQRSLTYAFPVLVAIVGCVAWALTGRALRPVEAIRTEVEEISGGTLHRRVPEPETGDEVARLARTMNAMLDRLEHASDRQRQFVSDASHELRSPVAAIRAQLEVALARPDTADWPGVAQKALQEEARLEALVADLLLLASVDEQGAVDHAVDVDLGALVRDEAARERAVPIAVDVWGGPVVVPGRADRLIRVVSNLLDNAARYASSAVSVTVEREGSEARLVVDDDGPGIPPADRERVFERFTRLDASRTRGDNGSAGLGLALAKAIVAQHHGTIWIEDAPTGGARFVVSLPR